MYLNYFFKNFDKFIFFFYRNPVRNLVILSLIISFFFTLDYFYLLLEYMNSYNSSLKIEIFLFFYLFDFFFYFFKNFFIFNLGCLTSILFINLNEKKNLDLSLNEKQQKYLYYFFFFFVIIIIVFHFFFFLNISNIRICFFFIIFILFFFKKIKNFINYEYNNINNNFLLYFNKNKIKIFIIFNLLIFIIFIIIIFFFIAFYYNKIYYYFFFDIIIFNINCILSFYFLNLDNKDLLEIQKKYYYYLFKFFLISFIFLFICFFYKFIFLIIINKPFFTTYKSIIFFYFYIYIGIFYYFLYLFLNKNKYNINFIKDICIYLFFFFIIYILIFFIILIIKYLISFFIINVYAMEDNIINENDKNEIKKSIKKNDFGFQKVNISDDRVYIGNCFLNRDADYFLNILKKECNLSPVRKRVVLINQVFPLQNIICDKVYDFGSYVKDNMLHIDEDIICHTMEVKKNSKKIFNSDENDL